MLLLFCSAFLLPFPPLPYVLVVGVDKAKLRERGEGKGDGGGGKEELGRSDRKGEKREGNKS